MAKRAAVGRPRHNSTDPARGKVAPERLAKLERAVKAAIGLRRYIEDIAPEANMKMLSVPREAVEKFDAIMIELITEKGKS